MDHTGFPVRTGPVEPGSTHDPTAARLHVLPALYRSAWPAMPVLADKGYQGAGIGILVPTKNPRPTPDEQTRNNLLSAMRAPAERANAMFKHFRALQRVSPGPRDHHHDHGRRPRHHHPLARFLTRTLVRKAHCIHMQLGGCRHSVWIRCRVVGNRIASTLQIAVDACPPIFGRSLGESKLWIFRLSRTTAENT